MQTAWTAIIAGVFAIAGAISGQLVAAWREEKRIRRETERDDIRWTRERERDRDERLQTYRLECYSEFSTVLRALHTLAMRALGTDDVTSEEMASYREEYATLIRTAESTLGRIELVGNEKTVKAAERAHANYDERIFSLEYLRLSGDDRIEKKWDELDELTVKFIAEVKNELHV